MVALLVEDGTGLAGANVYDPIATCEAFLVSKNLVAFAAKSDDEKAEHLINATRHAERKASGLIEGLPINSSQGLLLPRKGCYLRSGRLLAQSERPLDYRHGIFLFAEADASSTGALAAPPEARIQKLRAGLVNIDFRMSDGAVTALTEEGMALIRCVMNKSSWTF